MKNINKFISLLTLGSIFLIIGLVAAESKNGSNTYLGRLSTGSFDGNRIHDDLENNGMIVSHRLTGHSGMEWPAGSHLYSIFASGIWFSGKVGDAIRTAVAEFGPEFSSGSWGADPDGDDKLFIVNKSDLADPLANDDFQNWPAHLGAPWVDNDNDGVYSPLPNGTDHPEFLGDQVIWYVMNDGVSSAHTIFSTAPLGIEVRVTIWGYDRPDSFGDMMFVKAQAFNLGGNDIKDMYIGLWADPDLGDAGDDFVGCDTTLSLGYCYNDGADNSYGSAAPAIGYDFFQAAVPGLATDTTVAFGKSIPGMQKLEMSSFIKYINGDPVFEDPNDSEETYNYMSGKMKNGLPFVNSATGLDSKFVHACDPNENVDGNDDCWVDSDDHASGDRRFLMNVGPFDFSEGDSLELVFGIMHAQGADPLNSITLLKQVDGLAQLAYDIQFALPATPGAPVVNYSTQCVDSTATCEINLSWDSAQESYTAADELDRKPTESSSSTTTKVVQTTATITETHIYSQWNTSTNKLDTITYVADSIYTNPVIYGGIKYDTTYTTSWVDETTTITTASDEATSFAFEGYNVWQYDNAIGTGSKKLLATYDKINGVTSIEDEIFDINYGANVIIVVQNGTDSGIKRSISIKKDWLNNGVALIPERAYYYAVTAYGYNEHGIPKTLEGSGTIMKIRPQSDVTKIPVYTGALEFSDDEIIHSAGQSDGNIEVVVEDPFSVTGHNYKVTFSNATFYSSGYPYDVSTLSGWTVTENSDTLAACYNNAGGSCNLSAHTDETACVAASECSNTSLITESTCIVAGTCSNTTYTTNATCIAETAGTCSDTTYITNATCIAETAGTCSDITYTTNATCIADGSCTNTSATNEADCSTGCGAWTAQVWSLNTWNLNTWKDSTETWTNGFWSWDTSACRQTIQVWNVTDETSGSTVISNQTLVGGVDQLTGETYGTDEDDAYTYFDGLKVQVKGAPSHTVSSKVWDESSGTVSPLYTSAEEYVDANGNGAYDFDEAYEDEGVDGIDDIFETGYIATADANTDPSADNYVISSCSSGTSLNKATCIATGTCSNTSATDSTACVVLGACSDAAQTTQNNCFCASPAGDWTAATWTWSTWTSGNPLGSEGNGVYDAYPTAEAFTDGDSDGIYDYGELFEDFGADATTTTAEPGYQAANPDPAGDNYRTVADTISTIPEIILPINTAGTEGNLSYDIGENFTDANSDGSYTTAEAYTDANLNGAYDAAYVTSGSGWMNWVYVMTFNNWWGGQSSIAGTSYPAVEVRFVAMQSFTDANANGQYDSGEVYTWDTTDPNASSVDMYRTWGAEWTGFNAVPYSVWNIDTTPATQLHVVQRDLDNNGRWDGKRTGNYNYIWVTNVTYDGTSKFDDGDDANDFMYNLIMLGADMPVYYTVDIDVTSNMLAKSGTITITPARDNLMDDSFTFSTESLIENAYDCSEIGVWPNPYFGYNPEERNAVDNQIHFIGLSSSATIRIYDLGGNLVNKILHTSSSNEIWDVKNSFGISVASGMYIAAIEAEGCSKILKVAVITPEQRIDVY